MELSPPDRPILDGPFAEVIGRGPRCLPILERVRTYPVPWAHGVSQREMLQTCPGLRLTRIIVVVRCIGIWLDTPPRLVRCWQAWGRGGSVEARIIYRCNKKYFLASNPGVVADCPLRGVWQGCHQGGNEALRGLRDRAPWSRIKRFASASVSRNWSEPTSATAWLARRRAHRFDGSRRLTTINVPCSGKVATAASITSWNGESSPTS